MEGVGFAKGSVLCGPDRRDGITFGTRSQRDGSIGDRINLSLTVSSP